MSFSQRSFISRADSVPLETNYNVFFVNYGYMLVVTSSKDATIADVSSKIYDAVKVPISDQMLLLSNGDRPESEVRLSDHSVGSMEKPLYLCRKIAKDEIAAQPEIDGVNDLLSKLQDEFNILDANKTNAYAKKVAQSCIRVSSLVLKCSVKVVEDQYQLTQAWQAMLAFLDEQRTRFNRRYTRFENMWKKMEIVRSNSKNSFEDFDEVFEKLKQISLPEKLTNDTPQDTLYGWIKSKDPVFHLNDLVAHVEKQLNELDDQAIRMQKAELDNTKAQLDQNNVRNITGLDRRISLIRARLLTSENKNTAIINATKEVIASTDGNCVQMLKGIHDAIREIAEETGILAKSKYEVMNAIKTRISAHFFPVCDVFIKTDRKLTTFEEKARVLGDQLNLLTQIRETPILYVTAVAEVIRRLALRKEFDEWQKEQSDKCALFLDEENKLRSEFNRKLEKHFLRFLFPGMMHMMPAFSPTADPFDQNLPNIDHSYLHMLREKLKDMSELLNVTAPNVYNRLVIAPKDSQKTEVIRGLLQRDESFFIPTKTTNIAMLNRDFPSTNYLSGFDTECSPGSFNLNRFNGAYCSQGSLNYPDDAIGTPTELKPMFDLGSREDSSMSLSKNTLSESPYRQVSEPISIPTRGMNSNQISATSSQFSTPDDNIGSPEKVLRLQQFSSGRSFSPRWIGKHSLPRLPEAVDNDADRREKELEKAKQVIKSLAEDISSFKAEVDGIRTLLRENEQAFTENLNASQFADVLREVWEQVQSCIAEQQQQLEKVVAEKQELSQIVEHEKYLRREKERELEEAHNLERRHNEEMLDVIKAKDDLHVDILRLETEKRKLEQQIQNDSPMDYFNIELKTFEDVLQRPLMDEEIGRIKAEIEKRRVVSPTPSEHSDRGPRVSSTQQEYEKAYRTKLMLIIHGVRQQKDLEIKKVRDELEEAEARRKECEQSAAERIAELEKKLAACEQQKEASQATESEIAPSLMAQVASSSTNQPTSTARLEELMAKNMAESCLIVSPTDGPGRGDFDGLTPHPEDIEDDAAADEEVTSINTVGVQTRIRQKEMNMMISLVDIHEGCCVLVMWDNSHSSYMVFSTSRTLHFVRESAMRRFGVEPQSPVRRTWMFAVVVHLDYCQIRKDNNRYKLPIGTRFYRLDVRPLTFDQVSSSAPGR